MRYVVFLRGINVGGNKPMAMKSLVIMFENMGCENVVSYLQSGNIVFDYKKVTEKALSLQIKKQIEITFKYDLTVKVFHASQFNLIVNENPFAKDKNKSIDFLHATFFEEPLSGITKTGFENKLSAGEEMHATKHAIFLYCPRGYAACKLTNNYIETQLKIGATTRNWKTVQAMIKLLEM
jgi:uncharacterized protein (DUF1697 family)